MFWQPFILFQATVWKTLFNMFGCWDPRILEMREAASFQAPSKRCSKGIPFKVLSQLSPQSFRLRIQMPNPSEAGQLHLESLCETLQAIAQIMRAEEVGSPADPWTLDKSHCLKTTFNLSSL